MFNGDLKRLRMGLADLQRPKYVSRLWGEDNAEISVAPKPGDGNDLESSDIEAEISRELQNIRETARSALYQHVKIDTSCGEFFFPLREKKACRAVNDSPKSRLFQDRTSSGSGDSGPCHMSRRLHDPRSEAKPIHQKANADDADWESHGEWPR
jgi:hypothetical protein